MKNGAVDMETVRRFADDPMLASKPVAQWDVAGLLKLMWETWNDVFRNTLGHAERSLVSELRDARNKLGAPGTPSPATTPTARSTRSQRLLTAVSAPQADEVGKMKMELRRLIFDEQVRSEKRKSAGTADREPGHRHPEALARGGDAAHATWRAAAISRRSSPPTSGRCTSARARTSTAIRPSSSAAPT